MSLSRTPAVSLQVFWGKCANQLVVATGEDSGDDSGEENEGRSRDEDEDDDALESPASPKSLTLLHFH